MLVPFLVSVVVSQTPMASPQPDVELVARLHEVVRSQARRGPGPEGPLERELVTALEDTCHSFAVERGLPALRSQHADALGVAIEEWVRGRLARAWAAPQRERTEALLALAREVTASSTAEEVVSEWLGLPPLRATASAPTNRAPLSQVEAGVESTGELVLVPASTRVVEEGRGAGEHNGVIDRGEWVKLRIGLENTGALPWFSTQATIEPRGGCAWSDPRQVHTMGEVGAGEDAEVAAWIYVASSCPPEARSSLLLRFHDRQRAQRGESVVEVVLLPMEVAPPRIARSGFTASDLDREDGSDVGELGPSLTIEYFTDLSFERGDVVRASLRYSVPSELEGLFATRELREAEMVRTAPGSFAAGDDLDATTVPVDAFRSVLNRAQRTRDWIATGRRGLLPVAVDVSVSVMPPNLAPAHASAPWLGLAVTAGGAELVFDEAGFDGAYESIALKKPKADRAAAPTSASIEYRYRLFATIPVLAYLPSEPPAPTAEPRATPAPSATLPPVASSAPAPEPAMAIQPAAALPPKASEAAHPPLSSRSSLGRAWFRIDLAAGVSRYGVTPPAEDVTMWDGASQLILPALSSKLFVGPHLSAVVAVYGGLAAFEPKRGQGVLTVPEVGGGLGAGYLFEVWHLEATPYALFDYRYREISGLVFSTSSALTVGATVRYPFSERWRAVLDATWTVGPGSPNLDGVELISGGGPRIVVGAGLKL